MFVQEIMLVDALEYFPTVGYHMAFLVRFNLDCTVEYFEFLLQQLSDLVESIARVSI